jgi:large subunit ribosomal protein L25
METVKITAKYRSDMSKSHVKEIRRNGWATASLFGHTETPISLEIDLEDLVKKIKGTETGAKSILEVKVDGGPKDSGGPAVIKKFDRHALTKKVLDLQLQRVYMKELINVSVPVRGIGEAPGVKDGGILEEVTNELHIRCLPGTIPAHFDVDISDLQFMGHIRVSDVPVPEGIEILNDPDTIVFTCVPPHVTKATPAEEATAAAAEATAATATEAAAAE